ncbi:unnamed protein product, partial [Choristocarpus tenellus]
WTVDTVPPDTLVDTGPPHEGDAPRPEEADPFLFFTFHCSEDSCQYRYQFDNRLELNGAWEAGEGMQGEGGPEVAGQVSVIQTNAGATDGPTELQLSVFLSISS